MSVADPESDERRLVGRYEILREIGRGGMAFVYVARQRDLDRQVALKELRSLHASSAEFAHRFLRESRLAGSLNHPNIVTVHEYFEYGGTPYIAMEYVPRGSLRLHMRSLSLARVAGVLEGVLAALAHGETAGIVHRDLKPENIMVTADGRVKLADFGIARATQKTRTKHMTATGMTVGTPTYMAPEQAMAAEVGPWTDLYSVGVLTYELLVGRPPFHDTESPVAVLMRHVNEPIPSPIEVSPQIDPALSRWVDSLLVKDANDRVRHATIAWDGLEEIVVSLLGPLWRRDARLLDDRSAPPEVKPQTPEPVESHRPATSSAPPRFVTFNPRGQRRREPARERPEPVPRVDAAPEQPLAPQQPKLATTPEPEWFVAREPEPEPEPVTHAEPEPVAHAEPEPVAHAEPQPVAPEPEPPPLPEPEPPAAATPVPSSSRHRNRFIVIGVLVAVVAAAAGFILAPRSGPSRGGVPRLTRTAVTGPLSISYPRDWRQVAGHSSAVGSVLATRVTLEPADGDGALVVGVAGATGSPPLPRDVASALASAQGVTVKLGPYSYRRFLDVAAPWGVPETLYALLTTAGTVVADCVGATRDVEAFAASCERSVASLRLRSGSDRPINANPQFARALNAIVSKLHAATTAASGQLLAAKRLRPDQAAAAQRLASAYYNAARADTDLLPGPAGADANRDIAKALRALGSAYTSLASAAGHGDRRGYDTSRDAVANAQGDLTAGFARFRLDGYAPG